MTTNDATPREADRAEPAPDAIERVAKAMWDVLETGRAYEFFMGGSAEKPRLSAFTWEDLPRMARAALQAAAVEPEPGLDEAIAELRSLVFGKRKKVFALLKMNERHALQGEHRVLWPDAILGLDAKAIADAVRQVKGTEEGSA